jgi:hypothetical protein
MRRILAVLALAAGLGAGDAAVEAPADPARDLLREQGPPWYDAQRDDWRRIEVPKPREAEPDTGTGGGGGSGIGGFDVSVLAWILVAALAAAVALAVFRLLSERNAAESEERETAARPATPAARIGHLPFAHDDRDPDEALREALAVGDWARAAVWIYVRTLLALDRAQVLRLERGATNRVHVAAVRRWAADTPGRRPAVPAMEAIVGAFEAVYFGRQPIDRERVEHLDREGRRAVALARGGEAAP